MSSIFNIITRLSMVNRPTGSDDSRKSSTITNLAAAGIVALGALTGVPERAEATDKSGGEIVLALNTEVTTTRQRVEDVCAEKDAMLDTAKTMRAEGLKPTADQRREGLRLIKACKQAEAADAVAEAGKSGAEADRAVRELAQSIIGRQ